MYTQYVGNHDNASEFLKRTEKDNRRFRDFLADNLLKAENKNLSLASYLIMPIQRIPRYKLLIEELLRNTQDSHPDYPHLLKGLDLVSSVAKHINAEMHSAENRNIILRIQGEFSGGTSFVSPSRRFIKQGVMTKQCRSSDKPYEFFLFNDLLAYASKSGIISSGGKYKLHQEIPIVRRQQQHTHSAAQCPRSRIETCRSQNIVFLSQCAHWFRLSFFSVLLCCLFSSAGGSQFQRGGRPLPPLGRHLRLRPLRARAILVPDQQQDQVLHRQRA